MSAVVTDQFRIFNASNFVESVLDTNNSYYVFLGTVVVVKMTVKRIYE